MPPREAACRTGVGKPRPSSSLCLARCSGRARCRLVHRSTGRSRPQAMEKKKKICFSALRSALCFPCSAFPPRH
eukprot:15095830-Alexandrium_andersonii.AAC.1